MVTETLNQTLDAGSDAVTYIFDAGNYRDIVFSVEWYSLNSASATIEIQSSTDKVNWSCYGGSQGVFTLDASSGYQILEIAHKITRYWRLSYTKNNVISGTIIVRTDGVPLFPRT